MRSKLRLTEYTADITTQETDCRYVHHIKSLQNYQTIVCRRATLRAVKYAPAIEHGGMGFTKFEAYEKQDNDETYESPPVHSDIGVRIIKANDTNLEYTIQAKSTCLTTQVIGMNLELSPQTLAAYAQQKKGLK